jgi:MoxR-like ATPase
MFHETPAFMYRGDGQRPETPVDRGVGTVTHLDFTAPAGYVPDPGLRAAVNVALLLGQPLLLAGEPGTGKSQLASSVAYELGLSAPLVFYTKSDSAARDLFYQYDALAHFHASQFEKLPRQAREFVKLSVLGEAISRASQQRVREGCAVRSVVLVDEIDKAPRDFSNDILNEVEHMEFTVEETGETFRAHPKFRPIMILTTNSERALPDAFLRRCLYYYVAFPREESLLEILSRRLATAQDATSTLRASAIAEFLRIRELPIRKKPATAELLIWTSFLEHQHIDVTRPAAGQHEALLASYGLLLKYEEDRQLALSAAPASRVLGQ